MTYEVAVNGIFNTKIYIEAKNQYEASKMAEKQFRAVFPLAQDEYKITSSMVDYDKR